MDDVVVLNMKGGEEAMGDVAVLNMKEGPDGNDFRQFIEEIRESCGMLHPPYGIRILPDVEKTKVFTARLNGDGELILKLILGQKNVYLVAWENRDHVFIFDDLKYTFQTGPAVSFTKDRDRCTNLKNGGARKSNKKLAKNNSERTTTAASTPPGRDYPGLATAKLAGLNCDYHMLCALAGEREKIVLGFHALRKALEALNNPVIPKGEAGYPAYIKNIAYHVMVIILMIPECVRFNDMLDAVINVYDHGGCINRDLAGLLNNWSTLSKDVVRYPPNFDDLNDEQKRVIKNLAVALRDAKN